MTHLGAIKSDHTPFLLNTNSQDSFVHRPFRFEAAWIRDNGCNTVVEKAWNEEFNSSAFIKLYKKQATTREALRNWNKEVFGHCQAKINHLMEKIVEVQKRPPSKFNGSIEENLQLELSKWLTRTRILWKQKSWELWVTSSNQIRHLFFSSFKNLFTKETVSFPAHLDNLLTSCISEMENLSLKIILTLEEIKETLF